MIKPGNFMERCSNSSLTNSFQNNFLFPSIVNFDV